MRSLFASAPLFFAAAAAGFDMGRSDNVVAYWGQDSYGASNPGADASQLQQSLAAYCDDDSVQTFPMAFLDTFFGADGLPEIDLANTCGSSNAQTFPGTGLLDCSFLADDINTCQSKGKIVTLSLGGASGSYGFTSDSQAQQFADNIWNMFLGGSSPNRPFGNAVLDGVDLDIEGGSQTGYVAFVNQLRSHFNGASKTFYVTAAPQCPFPDAYIGSTLSAAHFDAVYVQFYNNYCGLQNFDNDNAWNFGQWDNWAKTQSPNKNVKVYIGAPASSSAAGSGYVDAATLGSIAASTRAQYSSFGGVMFWDISQARANNRFDAAIRASLTNGSVPPAAAPSSSSSANPPASVPVNAAPTPSTSSSGEPSIPSGAPSASDACNSAAWNTSAIYWGGQTATYQGAGYLAKWWTTGETPGTTGEWGVWVELGLCSSKRATRSRAHLARMHRRSH